MINQKDQIAQKILMERQKKRVQSKHGRLHVLKKSIQKAYVVEARPHAMTTNSTRLVALGAQLHVCLVRAILS